MAQALCLLHAFGIGLALGGWDGITSPWPIPNDDHPMHFHSAVALRGGLWRTGFTATYDPSFMAGYPLSVISDQSGTVPQLAVNLFGGRSPAVAYKISVWLTIAAVPYLILGAVRFLGGSGQAALGAVALDVLYLWTDWPLNYAKFGMMTFLLGMPAALWAALAAADYLERGGLRRWLAAALAIAGSLLVHALALMVLVPAVAIAYLFATFRRSGRLTPGRHLGAWAWILAGLGLNFWWLVPWFRLGDGRDAVPVAFHHSHESVWGRLAEIAVSGAPIQAILWGGLIPGLLALAPRRPLPAVALGGFLASGLGWGFLAGFTPALDFLQPGRHTYSLYTAAALTAGFGWSAALGRLAQGRPRLDIAAILAILLLGSRIFTFSIDDVIRRKLDRTSPFLSSQPTPRLLWLVNNVKEHVRPGQRLLYEEGGKALPGYPDVFQAHRYGGLLPYLTGVEVIGGPFLHVMIRANHVQFGEGKLVGQANWNRADFEAMARVYRPEAIVCWSARARAFCEQNPDLIEIKARDDVMTLGLVKGFEGAASEGTATVRARPGLLEVEDAMPGVDGRVVLRYHFDPHLRSQPPVRLEPVSHGSDPVPMLGFRPEAGRMTIALDLCP
ncbi:MAG: hypothetical protein U0800_09000 [Isosphaeraceae bacterium]